MASRPRYIVRRYLIGGEEQWRVYDEWMQLPLTNIYKTRKAASQAADNSNDHFEANNPRKD